MDQISELMIETQRETRRLWLFSKQTTSEKLYDQHMEIYKAILKRDEELAREAMLSHLENVENILRKYFEETVHTEKSQ